MRRLNARRRVAPISCVQYRAGLGRPALAVLVCLCSFVAVECADQVLLAREQIVDADVQGDGGEDVIGLAAVHDVAGLFLFLVCFLLFVFFGVCLCLFWFLVFVGGVVGVVGFFFFFFLVVVF